MQMSRRWKSAGLIAAVAIVLAAVGCSSGSSGGGSGSGSAGGGKPVKGGTVTVALPAATTYNWIFPFFSVTVESVFNVNQFQWLMYRPLYMFGGNNTSVNINYALSPAKPPKYSDGGKTVTVSLKDWKWSNGETVNAKDVVFFMNMVNAEKKAWYATAPGLLPDNVVSYKATGPDEVTFHLDKAYSSLWYTYNQLDEITPMPMAWDVTKAGAAAGSGGCTTDSAADGWAKCKKVYGYLNGQAQKASTFASSPIWSVVDGPWKLSSFNTDGNVTMVPNAKYSGSPKPQLSAIKFLPYTSDSTEYTALRTGQVDVGYIPTQDLPPRPASSTMPATNPLGTGFKLQGFYPFGINYYQVNFNNPTVGPLFRQLYIRQALQLTLDQQGMDKADWRGYANPTTGPAPSFPDNQWLPDAQKANNGQGPYPFDVAKATKLLTSHGWSKVGGVMTCQDPAKCGTGIKKGQQLKFTIDYVSGSTAVASDYKVYASDASEAGIAIQPVSQTFNTVISESAPCAVKPSCNWQAIAYGGWVFASPTFEPTGEALFQSGAFNNSGSYDSATMDSLISQTHTSSSLDTFHQFATYTAQQLPNIWLPNHYTVQAVSTKVHGVTFSPVFTFLPEYWYLTK
jgi:peptide/nickel transport system substrate-binding protein